MPFWKYIHYNMPTHAITDVCMYYVGMYACMYYVCMYVYMYVTMHVCMYACMYMYVHVCMYVLYSIIHLNVAYFIPYFV